MLAVAGTTFLAGALMGAGLALAFAPKSGQELREDITEAADAALKKIKTAVNEGKAILAKATATDVATLT